MKLENNYIDYDGHMDRECVELCDTLNNIPYVITFGSCSGHGNDVFRIWFKCYNLGVLSRLARAVNRNYSDGCWEIVADSTDTDTYGIFCLRTNAVLTSGLETSIHYLIEGIEHWFKDEFDEYFDLKL